MVLSAGHNLLTLEIRTMELLGLPAAETVEQAILLSCIVLQMEKMRS